MGSGHRAGPVRGGNAVDRTPAAPVVPSLVKVADPSFLISDDRKGELGRRGFTVRTVKGAGHTIHRDDFEAFTGSLDGWVQGASGGSWAEPGPDRGEGRPVP